MAVVTVCVAGCGGDVTVRVTVGLNDWVTVVVTVRGQRERQWNDCGLIMGWRWGCDGGVVTVLVAVWVTG